MGWEGADELVWMHLWATTGWQDRPVPKQLENKWGQSSNIYFDLCP